MYPDPFLSSRTAISGAPKTTTEEGPSLHSLGPTPVQPAAFGIYHQRLSIWVAEVIHLVVFDPLSSRLTGTGYLGKGNHDLEGS